MIWGNTRLRQSEQGHHWADELRAAGADVVASFDLAGHLLAEARARGQDRPEDDLYAKRNRPWGYFRMTPLAWHLEDQLWDISKAYESLKASYNEEDVVFDERGESLFQAITEFEKSVRRLIDPSEPPDSLRKRPPKASN